MRYADACCKYHEEFINGQHYYVFVGPCLVTKKIYSVVVPAEELYNYRRGQYIQEALRSVSDGDREFLISGYSPEGWKQVFWQS